MKFPFRYACYLGVSMLLIAWLGFATPIVVVANTATPTPTIGPEPIIPLKPVATNTTEPKAKLEIVRYETDPVEVRAQESFTLILKIKNLGTATATDWAVRHEHCPGKDFAFEDGCIRSIPILQPDEGTTIYFRVRYVNPITAPQPEAQSLKLQLLQEMGKKSDTELLIFVLPSRTITDEAAALKRPIPKPLLVVHRTWTAKARATVNELLTAVPLVINKLAVSNSVGGPEFEVVVELQNQGSVEAANIFIDFCDTTDNFNPVYAGCHKQVPTTLAPGANAIASQTMAYQNELEDPAKQTARGDKVNIEITYEFWYEGQWLRESISDTVYLYPQFFPAVTPIPPLTVTHGLTIEADLVVNTPQLNIRSGPGVNYPVVGVTYQGARFPVKAHHQHEWWQINFNGVLAWVSAQYVIARGAEKIEQVTTTPVPPPPTPIFTPNPNPVGLGEFPVTTAPVAFVPPAGRTATPTPLPSVPLQQASSEQGAQVLLINAAAGQGETGGVAASGVGAALSHAPLVIVERYQTAPAQLHQGEPFLLELVLRNIGARPVQQLLLSWQGTAVIPLGTGTTISLAELPAGAAMTIQGHFVINPMESTPVTYLPIQLLYANEAGELTPYTEQLALLHPVGGRTSSALAWPQGTVEDERPLWLRVLFGLMGLGAE